MKTLSHLDRHGKARMVNVGRKPSTHREATAIGEVRMSAETLSLLKKGSFSKGDVLSVSRIAGILAAKKVDELIPLCHTLTLDAVRIDFKVRKDGVLIRSIVRSGGKTGVEMEALTAVSVAALTIYDMCKSAEKDITICSIFLAKKSGGRSGTYERAGVPAEWTDKGGDRSQWL